MVVPNCTHPVMLFNRQCVDIITRAGGYYAEGRYREVSNWFDYFINYSDFSPYKLNLYCSGKQKGTSYFCDTERADTWYCVDPSSGECVPMFILVPCNNCELCHERKRNALASRLACESSLHSDIPIFVTLTYRRETCPVDGVNKSHIIDFFKRLRINLAVAGFSTDFRYFLASEYGKNGLYTDVNGRVRRGTNRPHYHCVFYGLRCEKNRISDLEKVFALSWSLDRRSDRCFSPCVVDGHALLPNQIGHVDVQFIRSIDAGPQYVAKYLHKPQVVPAGCNKPFISCSRRPALGLGFLTPERVKFLRECIGQPLMYKGVDGSIREFRMCQYYMDKVFPTRSRMLPVELRKSFCAVELEVYNLLLERENWPQYTEHNDVDVASASYSYFSRLFLEHGRHLRTSPPFKVQYNEEESVDKLCMYAKILSQYIDYEYIEYVQKCRSRYLSNLEPQTAGQIQTALYRARKNDAFVERLEHYY